MTCHIILCYGILEEPMKRNAVALIVHPYKDALMPRDVFAARLGDFAKTLADAADSFQNVRFNLAMPAYFLEILDPLLLLRLREMYKRGQIEWLFTGYTEPFVSFSTPWLLSENYKHGISVYNELTGCKPAGAAPPHSNWEPSIIDILRGIGLQYCVLSTAVLPAQHRPYCGYWIAEHMGSSMAFFPAHAFPAASVPRFLESMDALFEADPRKGSPAKILCVDMLLNCAQQSSDSLDSISAAIRSLDSTILSCQPMRCSEFMSSHFNMGLQFPPPSLVFTRDAEEADSLFLNRLHAYDQAGIIQRKLMDLAENIAGRKESKPFETIKKSLYFVQDISRFMPSRLSGFLQATDRLWSFEKLIDIQRILYEKDNIKGGHIRIIDFLKNGTKTLILENSSLSVCIDYKNGGQLFEIDYKTRNFNACSALNPCRHGLPMIVECPQSKTAFVDHCLPIYSGIGDYLKLPEGELGDFVAGDFGYKVKKTAGGIKAVLQRNGTLMQGDKNCPLNLEKVIGLEKDNAEITFVYQLSNNSLTPYALRFGVESTFVLPGIGRNMAEITQGSAEYGDLGNKQFSMNQVTEWTIDDAFCGVRMHFKVQKPVDVWCFPVDAAQESEDPSHAVTLVINTGVTLEGTKAWTLLGTIAFKKLRIKKDAVDAI